MATAYEFTESRQNVTYDGDKPEWDLEYCVLDAADETEAYTAVIGVAPVEMFGLTRKAVRQPPKLKCEGGTTWKASVHYVVEEISGSNDAAGETTVYTLEFDTGGETFTNKAVDYSKQERYTWDDGFAPDIKGALGWDGKKADGISQVIAGLKMTLTATYPAERITANTIKAWSRATGKTNSDAFLGFAAGELLNLGAKGSLTLDALTLNATGKAAISFVFQASENILEPFNVGEIEIQQKRGWQHVDIVIGPYEDTGTTPPTVVNKPLHAYVSTIYEATSFRAMTGIR
jgi:hypothetical protein